MGAKGDVPSGKGLTALSTDLLRSTTTISGESVRSNRVKGITIIWWYYRFGEVLRGFCPSGNYLPLIKGKGIKGIGLPDKNPEELGYEKCY